MFPSHFGGFIVRDSLFTNHSEKKRQTYRNFFSSDRGLSFSLTLDCPSYSIIRLQVQTINNSVKMCSGCD